MIHAVITGNLTRNPEVKNHNGNNFTTFAVASNNYNSKKKEEPDFVECTANGKTGESIAKNFNKGNRICFMGSVRLRSWTGNDGKDHSAMSASTSLILWDGCRTDPKAGEAEAKQATPANAAPQTPAQPEKWHEDKSNGNLFKWDYAAQKWELKRQGWAVPAAPTGPSMPPPPDEIPF